MTHMFVPGPVDVAPEVLAAQAKPMLPHASREFEDIFRRTEERLRLIFGTTNPIYQTASTTSAMMEAVMRTFVRRSVLVCVNGAYSKRWQDIAAACGKEADYLDVPWGRAVTSGMLADELQKKPYDAVAVVHHETSTGVENPIREMAAAVRETSPDTLFLVNAASSLGGANLEMDAWGLDVVLAPSHKCLALPPGLVFTSASERAMRAAEQVENRGWALDLLQLDLQRLKDTPLLTPPIALIYALDVQLDRILTEGLDQRIARHTELSRRVYDWAIAHQLEPFAAEPYRSSTVAVLKNIRNWNIPELNKYLTVRGMRIAEGYQILKDRTLRIAVMGETTSAHLDALFTCLESW